MANVSEMDQAQIYKGQENTYIVQGKWQTQFLDSLHFTLQGIDWPKHTTVTFDASQIKSIDTNGAALLFDLINSLAEKECNATLVNAMPQVQRVLDLVREFCPREKITHRVHRMWWVKALDNLGKRVIKKYHHGTKILGFVGEIAMKAFNFFPIRLRSFKQFLIHVEQFGVNALPIIGLLSFLIGVVLAYQMGVQLRQYGGNIYVVDFSTFAILREFGPLIAAIIFAGRSGSAITAQLASMKLSEEIAALRVMGISPYERLILPRIMALLICVPLVTVWADVTGIIGAMVMGHHLFDINYITFLERVSTMTKIKTYVTGLIKTPFFALIIGVIGCFQGLNVANRSDAVGRNTTLSVVQSIFLIIIVDAIFSIVFSWQTL